MLSLPWLAVPSGFSPSGGIKRLGRLPCCPFHGRRFSTEKTMAFIKGRYPLDTVRIDGTPKNSWWDLGRGSFANFGGSRWSRDLGKISIQSHYGIARIHSSSFDHLASTAAGCRRLVSRGHLSFLPLFLHRARQHPSNSGRVGPRSVSDVRSLKGVL